jgi:hypothetical protein
VSLASPGRDGTEVEALITDRYLDSLLTVSMPGPVAAPEAWPDDRLRAVADRLARLPRVHPSFRFEEALSARLSAAARSRRLPAAAGAEGTVVSFRHPPGVVAPVPAGSTVYPDGLRIAGDEANPVRPLLIGGAITSALSLAGAAYVAWRLRRPVGTPMARAVRAVARTRLT